MFTVPIQVESEVRVTGKSEPAQVEYNISEGYPDEYLVEDQIGKYNIYLITYHEYITLQKHILKINWVIFIKISVVYVFSW